MPNIVDNRVCQDLGISHLSVAYECHFENLCSCPPLPADDNFVDVNLTLCTCCVLPPVTAAVHTDVCWQTLCNRNWIIFIFVSEGANCVLQSSSIPDCTVRPAAAEYFRS